MKNTIYISVVDVVGTHTPQCEYDAKILYHRIVRELVNGNKVAISFRNITCVSAAFVYNSIGELCGSFTEEEISGLIAVTNINESVSNMLKSAKEEAKQYWNVDDRYPTMLNLSGEV